MNAIRQVLFLTLASTLLIFSSCKNENVESISKAVTSTTCDTSAVRFTTVIKPILQANCNRCHDNSNASRLGSGIKLEDYADVVAERNNIIRVIDLPSNNASLMPKGGPKMSSCEITKIKAWVSAGAPE